MNILVLNCGSSSVKFQLISTDRHHIEHNTDKRLASGIIERIGGQALVHFSVPAPDGSPRSYREALPLRDHSAAIEKIVQWIISPEANIPGITTYADIDAVGHRVAHGGETLTSSVIITESVLKHIEDCIELAPLHNPHNLKGIYAINKVFGGAIKQVAAFDTAFHHTLPDYAYLYALPYQFYRRHKIRRYGFHGVSHRYVQYRYRILVDIKRDDVHVISIHLGNGCSVCAIKGGRSIDTSMGMTPLEGLVMGTRSGDIDPAILEHLCHKEGYSLTELGSVLNKQSGLLGISGLTNDMRELIAEAVENDDRRAKLAIDIFTYRVKKYIGAYLAAMNGASAIIFTGGIGENAAYVREKILQGLDWFGVHLDHDRNTTLVGGKEGKISDDNSRLDAWVIPTNEELLIARDTFRCVMGQAIPR
ncbi:MAG: acetate kinase [Bacteroidota bacterium]|nr:acetate kinase [Candidatus Kapabacteria bacterium]MDW8220968.1 acetate kinase [Bacteroidota bacterium]